MKKFLFLWLVAEFLVAYFLVSSGCFLRGAQVHAYAAWRDHPTPETTAEFDRQKRITEFQTVVIAAVLFCGIAAPTLLIARAWRRGHPGDLQNENNES